MDLIDLSCPEPDNYAAVAKQLHQTALQAEQRIYALEYQLRAAANRPTIIQTTTAPMTGLLANIENLIGPTFGGGFTTTFNNSTLASDQNMANNSAVFVPLGEGIYELGLTGILAPSGVADAGSYRMIQVKQYTPDATVVGGLQNGYRQVDAFGYTTFEPAAGVGMEFTLAGHFRCKPLDIIFFTLIHNNTSSTLTLSTGSIGWLHKASDASITAVL